MAAQSSSVLALSYSRWTDRYACMFSVGALASAEACTAAGAGSRVTLRFTIIGATA
jgi:hypothetical protein